MAGIRKWLYFLMFLALILILYWCLLIWLLAPRTYSVAVSVYPLPGGLDDVPVFNSNSPEVVDRDGILLSTLPPASAADAAACLDFPFIGNFTYFSHHIANGARYRPRRLYLGLLATNPGPALVTLKLWQGASFLSLPDAPFYYLPPATQDPLGNEYSGPGDRVATELLHGRSPLPPQDFYLLPGATQLLASWPVPTDNPFVPINGRSTLLRFTADAPVYLLELVAISASATHEPSEGDYLSLLARKTFSGPHEKATVELPATGPFYYGRVAGVSRGDGWQGTIRSDLLSTGGPIGFPLAASLGKELGSGQVQSAPLLRRYPDTAFEAHANYGVTYKLRFPLSNAGLTPAVFTFRLSHPLRIEGSRTQSRAIYQLPPNEAITYRGTLRLDWRDENGVTHTRFAHVVLHDGELGEPFAAIHVPPRRHYDLTLTTIYPADATPPQLLTVARS